MTASVCLAGILTNTGALLAMLAVVIVLLAVTVSLYLKAARKAKRISGRDRNGSAGTDPRGGEAPEAEKALEAEKVPGSPEGAENVKAAQSGKSAEAPAVLAEGSSGSRGAEAENTPEKSELPAGENEEDRSLEEGPQREEDLEISDETLYVDEMSTTVTIEEEEAGPPKEPEEMKPELPPIPFEITEHIVVIHTNEQIF